VHERFACEIVTQTIIVCREPSSTAIKRSHFTFDWIYIDGDHHYEAVLQDLELYFPKVKVGGYIVYDDYDFACNF
jgi:cephalosporin hydroxylase